MVKMAVRQTAEDFELDGFRAFIEENDGQILKPTNEWEVLRYKIARNTFVIYRNKRNQLNLGMSARHIKAWKDGGRITKGKRQSVRDGLHIKARLLERDGGACACCGQFLGDDVTLEHWVGVASGGPNSPKNLALVHERCNLALGNLSVLEKFELCRRAQEIVAESAPWEIVGPDELFEKTKSAGR